jgi:3-hydroxyisobutyrate dehydrogenase-like beta-hydroxyacid dehydrogenase
MRRGYYPGVGDGAQFQDVLMTIDPIGLAGDGERAAAIAVRLSRLPGMRVIVHGFEVPAVRDGGAPKWRIERAANLFDLASECEAVVTVYATHAALRAALTGSEDRPGLLGALAPGALIADFSAGTPEESRRLAGQLSGRAIGLIEAAWDEAGGAVLLGGFGDHIAQLTPALSALGAVTRAGPQGSGRLLMALRASVQAVTQQALDEAGAIAAAHGLAWTDGDEPPRSGVERAGIAAHLALSLDAAAACEVQAAVLSALALALKAPPPVTPPSY